MSFAQKIRITSKNLLHDTFRCLRTGTIISLILALFTFIMALFISKFNINTAVQCVISSLFIVGSFGILINSLLILSKNSNHKLKNIQEWTENFKLFSYKLVLSLISFLIVMYGCIIDYITYNHFI